MPTSAIGPPSLPRFARTSKKSAPREPTGAAPRSTTGRFAFHNVLYCIAYANTFGGLAMKEANHLEARDDVASFCAARRQAEVPAGAGTMNKDETYAEIVNAVKAVPRSKPARQAAAPEATDAKPATPTDTRSPPTSSSSAAHARQELAHRREQNYLFSGCRDSAVGQLWTVGPPSSKARPTFHAHRSTRPPAPAAPDRSLSED